MRNHVSSFIKKEDCVRSIVHSEENMALRIGDTLTLFFSNVTSIKKVILGLQELLEEDDEEKK